MKTENTPPPHDPLVGFRASLKSAADHLAEEHQIPANKAAGLPDLLEKTVLIAIAEIAKGLKAP